MADEEEFEIDKPDIAMRFLSQAPPLQFPPVLDDVRTVIGDDALIDSVLPAARKAYNLEQMTSLDIAGGEHLLVTTMGEVGENQYLHPGTGKVYTVNHVDKAVVDGSERDATPAELGGDLNTLREAIQAQVKEYVGANFSTSVAPATYASPGVVTVCISGAEFDSKNMWSGRWRSTWVCKQDGADMNLTGTMQVHVHFYEDGNVQAKSSHTVEESVAGGSEAETAEAVVEAISKAEKTYHSMLDGAYINLKKDHSIMNGLRRPLPMDKRTIDFKTLVSQGKMVAGLR